MIHPSKPFGDPRHLIGRSHIGCFWTPETSRLGAQRALSPPSTTVARQLFNFSLPPPPPAWIGFAATRPRSRGGRDGCLILHPLCGESEPSNDAPATHLQPQSCLATFPISPAQAHVLALPRVAFEREALSRGRMKPDWRPALPGLPAPAAGSAPLLGCSAPSSLTPPPLRAHRAQLQHPSFLLLVLILALILSDPRQRIRQGFRQ